MRRARNDLSAESAGLTSRNFPDAVTDIKIKPKCPSITVASLFDS